MDYQLSGILRSILRAYVMSVATATAVTVVLCAHILTSDYDNFISHISKLLVY